MKTDKEEYRKIVEALRRSKPELTQYNSIEETVISRLSEKNEIGLTGILSFLFGWTFIGWVRKSLIVASFALLGFFLYQQHSIIKQIDDLGNKIRENDRMIVYNPSAVLKRRQMLIKYSGERSTGYYLSEEDLMAIIDSINHLNVRYRNLLDLIDDDTLLKKRVEEKLERKFGSKIKL